MIPRFPSFAKLDIAHKHSIENITLKFPPYSDYNFTSLWTYNTDDTIELSILNGNLVVRFVDYMSLKPFYSFIGNSKITETALTLIEHAQKTGTETYLKLVPECVVTAEPRLNQYFIVEEDRDNHDYMISAPDVRHLPEAKFKRKKYLVERFMRKYEDHRVTLLDLGNAKVQRDIIDLFLLWEKRGNRSRTDTENELTAIKRLLRNHTALGVYAMGVFHKDALIAFNLYEVTHKSFGISAFQKADKTYTGVYAFLSHAAAKHLHSLGCTHINYEQDLGISGLRLSKTLWKPEYFLKKYKITPKPARSSPAKHTLQRQARSTASR